MTGGKLDDVGFKLGGEVKRGVDEYLVAGVSVSRYVLVVVAARVSDGIEVGNRVGDIFTVDIAIGRFVLVAVLNNGFLDLQAVNKIIERKASQKNFNLANIITNLL